MISIHSSTCFQMEVIPTQSPSQFSPVVIPPRESSARLKQRPKSKPEDMLFKTATDALMTFKEQQERFSKPTVQTDTEQLFADYIARSIRSISDEKVRRRAEFKIHAVLFEILSEEERKTSNSSTSQQFSSFVFQPQPDFQGYNIKFNSIIF